MLGLALMRAHHCDAELADMHYLLASHYQCISHNHLNNKGSLLACWLLYQSCAGDSIHFLGLRCSPEVL
jgi:hypothetical protein